MSNTFDAEQKLISAAEEGVKNAFTRNNLPYESRTGAAVLTDKGNVYSSGQYFSIFTTNQVYKMHGINELDYERMTFVGFVKKAEVAPSE